MSGLDRYPDWVDGVTPGADPHARVCRFRPVTNVRAVKVTNGFYRNAPVSGVFELHEPNGHNPIEVLPKGKRQVKVMCAWHGRKPSKSCARIDVTNANCQVEVLNGYSGEVVDNIGYPTDPAPISGTSTPRPPALDSRSCEPKPAIGEKDVAPAVRLPAPPDAILNAAPSIDRTERIRQIKLWLETGVVAVTLIGGIIALVLRFK